MFSMNHIHLKAPDPRKTAQWYVDVFGAEVLLPITETATGSRISYIQAPDDVRIELVQVRG